MKKTFKKAVTLLLAMTLVLQTSVFTTPAVLTAFAESATEVTELSTTGDDAASGATITDETNDATDTDVGEQAGDEDPDGSVDELTAGDEGAEEDSEQLLDATEEELLDETEETTLRASGSADHYIAVASDRHGESKAIGYAMSGMPSNVEYVSLIGDMVGSGGSDAPSYNSSTVADEVVDDTTGVFPELGYGYVNDASILWADHDGGVTDDTNPKTVFAKDGTAGTSGLMKTGYNSDGTVAYYIYGIAFYDMYNKSGAQSTSSAATAFENWVAGIDKTIPIIVLCHVPLHYARSDNGYAVAWNKALNYAATGEETTSSGKEITRNVIFLHGHNHTNESNYEYYIPAGSTMQIYNTSNSSYIYYNYTTAGYLKANNSATLIAIDSSNITISKYKGSSSSTSTVTSTYASRGYKSQFSDTYDTAAMHTIARITDDKPSISLSPKTLSLLVGGDTGTVTATITNADNPTVTWSSGNTSVATVTAGDNNTGVVTGVAAGTATITASITVDGTEYAATCTVTVSESGSADSTVYVLTDKMTAGKNYLIVGSGSVGSSKALTHNSGTIGVDDVTINTGTDETDNAVYINSSDVDATSVWTATTSGDYTKLINTVNKESYYLQITSGSYTLSAATAETFSDNNWSFADNVLTLTYTGSQSSNTRYVVYSSDVFSGAKN